ncbi:LysR substrate-binding domain-containing protein [Pelagibacterium xiamenense]|uniref:LysR substrate-binding domain-containing protein n=1 Tax=Pelagibacterium xiamenense TaxID=2901140 RepID=UPI001E4BED7A|nr:LysR substrate-binding domain-containing protein [Pelagibacterium xiamenense]MCD7058773.1 LysR substrate-binding domain-containing protein [Pelagibacterium xiamenense]
MDNLPPLSAIRAFEAAARHLNFTAAADELAMTQAAVSYQVKLLEERLGVRLFDRRKRKVELTEAGARLAPIVTRSFNAMRDGIAALKQSDDGVLTVSAVTSFGTNWLVPRLGDFQAQYPDIVVRLDIRTELVDFDLEPVDVGIRAGRGVWPGTRAHKLRDVAFCPMIAPELLGRLGKDPSPADILKLPLIDPTDDWWAIWFDAAGVPGAEVPTGRGLQVLSQHLAGRAAIAGQGAAILEPTLFAQELASGLLVQPFDILASRGYAYWLVHSEVKGQSAKIRQFRKWIEGCLAAEAAG